MTRPNQLTNNALKVYQVLFKMFPKGIQMFNKHGIFDDPMQTIYNDGTVVVNYCDGSNYLEVFGLSGDEFEALDACINRRK